MTQRYNTKRQEKTAEVRRIRVGQMMVHAGNTRDDQGRSVPKFRADHCFVYLVDMTTGRELDTLGQDPAGLYWIRSDKSRNLANTRYRKGTQWTKKDAIQVAKQMAVQMGVPFHPTRDVVDARDIVEGTVRECLLCDVKDRSHEPFVCPTCSAHAAAGRLSIQQGEIAAIDAEGLIKYPGTATQGITRRPHRDLNRELVTALLQVAGIVPPAERFPREERQKLGTNLVQRTDRSSNRRWVWFRAPQGKIGGMRRIVELVEQIVTNAEAEGRRQGSNLLTGLMEGTVPPEVFHKDRGDRG